MTGDSWCLPVRQGFYAGLLLGFMNLSVFSAYALAMWYGGEGIISGKYTPGNIISIIGLALLGGSTVGQVRSLRPIDDPTRRRTMLRRESVSVAPVVEKASPPVGSFSSSRAPRR